MPHRGLVVISLRSFEIADVRIAALLYVELPLPPEPVSDKTPTKAEQNRQIRQRFANGETVQHLAQVYGISEQRVHQILQDG